MDDVSQQQTMKKNLMKNKNLYYFQILIYMCMNVLMHFMDKYFFIVLLDLIVM